MITHERIRSAVRWAACELGERQLSCSAVTVLPWSATALLRVGQRQYWIKVSPISNNMTESAILAVSRELGLSAMPTQVGFREDLGALLVEHVPSDPRPLHFAEVMAAKNQVCAALAERKADLNLGVLSASGCADNIAASCQVDRSWWIGGSGVRTLMGAIEKCNHQLATLDTILTGKKSVVHGDLHPGNIISSPRGPVFIDWADAAFGVPVWDLATYGVSCGRQSEIDNEFIDLLDVLTGLKEVADFLQTPVPVTGVKYSASILQLQQHVLRRVSKLIFSMNSLRLHSSNR